MPCKQSTPSDPISALADHHKLNYLADDIPLFSYQTAKGPMCLTKKDFLARCNAFWRAHGFPIITGVTSAKIGRTRPCG